MLSWIRKVLGYAKPSIEDVYCYRDGKRWVRGDPMGILRKLSTDEGFDYDRERMLAVVEGTVGIEAMGKLVEGIRRAFELPSVKQGGLTEPKVIRLLLNFMQWLEQVKKNSPPSPPAVLSILDTQDDDLPESKSLDSTSTPTEPVPSTQSPSSSESVPLSAALPQDSGTT